MILLPDEQIASVNNDIEPNIKKGASLPFSPTVSMCVQPGGAARGPRRLDGRTESRATPVRSTYTGGGVPHLVAASGTKKKARVTSRCPTLLRTVAAKSASSKPTSEGNRDRSLRRADRPLRVARWSW